MNTLDEWTSPGGRHGPDLYVATLVNVWSLISQVDQTDNNDNN